MREMRRKDRMLTEEEAMDVVRKGEYGVLSTVGEDGKPYAVPLSYVLDEEKKAIYFHGTAAGGQKMDNILANPAVCFTVVMNTEVLPSQFSTKYYSANVSAWRRWWKRRKKRKKPSSCWSESILRTMKNREGPISTGPSVPWQWCGSMWNALRGKPGRSERSRSRSRSRSRRSATSRWVVAKRRVYRRGH